MNDPETINATEGAVTDTTQTDANASSLSEQVEATPTKVLLLAGLQPGRIVNYVMKDLTDRPFLVVAVNSDNSVNGVLFFDGKNDSGNHMRPPTTGDSPYLPEYAHLLSGVPYGEGRLPNSWHWPTKQPVVAAGVEPESLRAMLEAELPKLVSIKEIAAYIHGKVAEIKADIMGEVNSLLDSHSETVKAAAESINRQGAGSPPTIAELEQRINAGEAVAIAPSGEVTTGTATSATTATSTPAPEGEQATAAVASAGQTEGTEQKNS